MSAYARYAVYVVPQGKLGAAGAAWLGWDIAQGAEVAQVDGLDLDLPALTQTPRKYGFHGTVMAPFQIRYGARLEDLSQAFTQLCAGIAPIGCDDLDVVALGRFVALIPQSGMAELRAMSAQVVEGLDIWRAPMTDTEFERRNRPGLSEVQRGYLRRWGYPHVMDAYRFHMTLTGRMPKAEAGRVVHVAQDYFAPVLAEPVRIDDLALVGERADGRFEVIARCALHG